MHEIHDSHSNKHLTYYDQDNTGVTCVLSTILICNVLLLLLLLIIWWADSLFQSPSCHLHLSLPFPYHFTERQRHAKNFYENIYTPSALLLFSLLLSSAKHTTTTIATSTPSPG